MSTDIFTSFATDENLENNGTWFPLNKDTSLLIAAAGNDNFAKAITAKYAEHRVELEKNDEAADALSKKIMIEVLAKTVLLDWTGVKYKGSAMSYSVDNAKTLLAHKLFRRQVEAFSNDQSAYMAKLEAEQGEA